MQVEISDLQKGLIYRGRVSAIRQTYYVLEASEYFFVLSFSRSKEAAGNFNVVDKKGVRYVQKAFAGQQGITSNAIVTRAARTKHAPTSLIALNILYILVATGAAQIEDRSDQRKLFFSIKRGSRH